MLRHAMNSPNSTEGAQAAPPTEIRAPSPAAPPAGELAPPGNRPSAEALRRSEIGFRTLIECLPQHIFFKDRHSTFLCVNRAFAADFGKTPDELVGKNDLDFFPEELARKYCEDDRRVMAQGQPETIEEINMVGDRTRIVEVVKAPVVDEQGAVMGLLGVFTDITERKVAEENLRAFTALLERSNRELQDFAYVASHDLQEPLRKVAVFGDRLKVKCAAALGDEGRDYLERMQKAVVRMQTLINDLLAFSRVTSKAAPFGTVDLGAVAREVLGDLETRLEQSGAQVEVGPLPTIEAEPLHMRQLLQNLLGNALKFQRPETKPVIKIAAELFQKAERSRARNAPTREWVRLSVSDNGIGFDEKYLDRIFQVFQRLHGRGEYPGSGVGLAITRKIVEHHNGEITARSRPGEGATFIVTLPVKQRKPNQLL